MLNHSPFSPNGHSAAMSSTGNTSAVDSERMDACTAFSTADMKLWVAKPIQRVR